jgi:hypothetical protein
MKWLAVVWRSLVVVWSRAVDELALRRPRAPCPPLQAPLRPPPSPVSQSHRRSLLKTLLSILLALALFLSHPPLSETVAIISILLYHYNSSGNVRSFSRRATPRRSGPSPRIAPFYNCFPRYLSILFTALAFTRPSTWQSLKPRWILMRQTSAGISMGIRVGINSETG